MCVVDWFVLEWWCWCGAVGWCGLCWGSDVDVVLLVGLLRGLGLVWLEWVVLCDVCCGLVCFGVVVLVWGSGLVWVVLGQ
jgi:hypothetical protein